MLLFVDYLRINGFSRIHTSPNMVKYREAYYEACSIMIEQSTHKEHLSEFFNIQAIFRVPTDEEYDQEVEVQVDFIESTPALLVKKKKKGVKESLEELSDEAELLEDEDEEVDEGNLEGEMKPKLSVGKAVEESKDEKVAANSSESSPGTLTEHEI